MRRVLTPVASAFCFAGALANAVPGQAQDAPAEPIVVTGERVQRTLARTHSSVAVVDRDALERQPDVETLDRLLETIPNVVLGSGGVGPTIRGQDTTGVLRDLPAFLGGTRPRTTLIVDGRAVSYNEFVFGTQAIWDVERVEVFRSPQSTTQGRNSIAGAIFVETQSPQHEWQAKVRGVARDSDAWQLSAAVTGPILKDQIAIRIAADRRRGKPASFLTTTAVGIDPNRDDSDLVRAKILLTPAAMPALRLDMAYHHARSQAPQIAGIRMPFEDRADPRVGYGIFRTTVDALTLRPTIDLGKGSTLKGTASFGSARIRRFAPPGLGEARNAVDDRSLEILYSLEQGAFQLVGGASVARSRLRQAIDLSAVGLGLGRFNDRQSSIGLFGEFRVEALDNLEVIVGARYQSDEQLRGGTLDTAAGQQTLDYDGRFESFSPKLSVACECWADATVGFLIQRAANPGGTTLSPTSGLLDTFRAESLWDYELFARGRLAKFDITYAVNAFYYDMTDAQRSIRRVIETPGGTFFLQEIGNVPRSWSRGAEVEASWSLANDLAIRLGLGLLQTRITAVLTDRDPLLDKEFQRSPRLTGSLALSWRPLDSVSLEFAYRMRSGYFSDDVNTPVLRVGAMHTLDARAEWKAGNLRLFGFVRNVFDRFYLTSLTDNGRLGTAGDPREAGVGAEMRF